MKKPISPGVLFIYFVFSLSLTAVAGFSVLSCKGDRKGIAAIDTLEPPPIPPMPPKPPSMIGNDTIWDMTSEMPMYPGGFDLLVKYISMQLKYPEAARVKGIQGKVVIKFRITSKGKVTDCMIHQGVSPELDDEALRIVSSIERFEPLIVEGKAVSAYYFLPINFKLK